MNLRNFYTIFLFLLGFAIIQSCSELPVGNKTNQAPHTYLSLFPDSTISPHGTTLKISWWGDDPDGFVMGYYFSFDSINWSFTTKNDSTFQLAIGGLDSTFHFWVAAVDDKGLRDPHPASNRYPVINTPPSVSFNTGTYIPDTTLPIATFIWTGIDPDGNNTIRHYHWALNDTTNWHTVASNVNIMTLNQDSGIVPNANNKFYLKAEDIAGAFSPVIKMPDSNNVWFVKPKVGKILIIDDYSPSLNDNSAAASFYAAALDTPSLSNNYTVLDIKVGNNANFPSIPNPMFTETLKLFTAVIWYAGRGTTTSTNASFDLAQVTLPYYLASGGKVFFTTGFPNTIESPSNIVNFAPVDSVMSFTFSLIPSPVSIVIDNSYPQLSGNVTLDFVRGIYPRIGANVIYKLPYNPPYDTNKINICIKDNNISPHMIIMSVPLHKFNGDAGSTYFLRRVLSVDFGIN